MVSVLLTTACNRDTDKRDGAYDRLRIMAERDAVRAHRLASGFDDAEIVLFCGSDYGDFRDTRQHPFYRRDPQRCFALYEGDYVIPYLPGVYACIDRWGHSPARTRSSHYTKVAFFDDTEAEQDYGPQPLLYSFTGRLDTSPTRRRLAALQDRTGLVEDRTPPSATASADDRRRYRRQFLDTLRRSLFVLCPRGLGCSSYRLFESMKAGRAPVIVSDDWVPPEGPRWEDFSIRIPQRRVHDIPRVLAERSGDAPHMGQAARAAHDRWFSMETSFNTICGWLDSIRSSRRLPEKWARHLAAIQRLRPSFVRRGLCRRWRIALGSRD